MTPDMSAAFVSYSREDSEFALRLASDLKAAAASVWLDQLDIVPGQRWDRAVEDALTNCPRMLVILSPASVNSTNVMDEVSFALEERKNVLPIMFRDCPLPFRLRRVQYIDFRHDYQRGLGELLRTLDARPVPQPDAPEVHQQPQSNAAKGNEPDLAPKQEGAKQEAPDSNRTQASELSQSDQLNTSGEEIGRPDPEMQRIVAREQKPPAASPAVNLTRNQTLKIFQFEEPKTPSEEEMGVAPDPQEDEAESPEVGFLSRPSVRGVALIAICGIAIASWVTFRALTRQPQTLPAAHSREESTASIQNGPLTTPVDPQSQITPKPLPPTQVVRHPPAHTMPKVVDISAGVAAGMLLQKVNPVYPPIARAAGVSGTVVLQAAISQAGTVEDLRIVSGPAMLQQAALDAVKSWRYKPYLLNNEPVEVRTTINVIFSLGG